jgi:hypothetical protein
MNTQYDKTISERIGNYLAGFTDGEGSFNVSLTKRGDYNSGNGYKLTLSFNVSQKDRTVLALFKRYLKCGRLQTRNDGVTYYKVENPKALKENVVPFFERFSFLSQQKINNFSIFKKIVDLVYTKQHLTKEGFKEIVLLREQLNKGKGRKRKFSYSDVYPEESSTTIRQTST